MISEENLVKLLDINPFSIPKLYQHHDLPVIVKTVLVVWQAIAFYILTDFTFDVKVIDVDTFVRKLSFINILVSTMIGIYLTLSSKRSHGFNLESLRELNSSPDSPPTITPPGVVIPVIICFLVAHVSAYTCLTISSGIIFMINYLLFASTNYTVTAVKHLVSKSFKYVGHRTVRSESPIEVVHYCRQVLAYSYRIEETYSLSVLVGLFGGVFMMCLSLTEYWKCWGLHKICDSFESNHPFISIISQYYTMCQLLLLGVDSTQQVGNVGILCIFHRIRQIWFANCCSFLLSYELKDKTNFLKRTLFCWLLLLLFFMKL